MALAMGFGSFGRTTAEAWRRFLGPDKNQGLDFSAYVQRWSDMGYGPIAVSLSLRKEVDTLPETGV